MAANLPIDPDLLDLALAVSGERTKKAGVTKAFIARQKRLLDLIGQLEWDEGFDYKAERSRRSACLSIPASGLRPSGAIRPSRHAKDASWFAPSKRARTSRPPGSFCRNFWKLLRTEIPLADPRSLSRIAAADPAPARSCRGDRIAE
jgi:hypothetical protein